MAVSSMDDGEQLLVHAIGSHEDRERNKEQGQDHRILALDAAPVAFPGPKPPQGGKSKLESKSKSKSKSKELELELESESELEWEQD